MQFFNQIYTALLFREMRIGYKGHIVNEIVHRMPLSGVHYLSHMALPFCKQG